MPLGPRAICILLWTWNNRYFTGPIDLCDPLEAIANNGDLCLKLRWIAHLLKIAAAACTEILTRRFDPHGRRFENLDDLSKRDPFLELDDLYANAVTGSGQWRKNGQPVGKADPKAVRNDPFNP